MDLKEQIIHDMTINYSTLSPQDFDAIVTGELIHLTLHLELEMNAFLIDYFLKGSSRKDEFRIHFFYRECLTLQEKIDIIKAVLTRNSSTIDKTESNQIIKIVEELKSLRNTLAHGFSDPLKDDKDLKIQIELYSRSGKRKTIEISPQNHTQLMNDFDQKIKQIEAWRKRTIKTLNKK